MLYVVQYGYDTKGDKYMSLILGYADKEKAIIMSDGKAGGTTRNSEHCNKTRKINKNIIVGFAGYLEDIEAVLDFCNEEMLGEIDNYDVNYFFDLMSEIMKDPVNQEHIHSSFIIIGKTKDGDMRSAIIGDSTKYKLEERTITEPRVLSIGGTIDGKIINEIYLRNIRNARIDIIERMENAVKEVSALDYSVNGSIFYQKI